MPIILSEIVLIFVFGTLPMIIASYHPNFEALPALANLNPGDHVLYYFASLLALHLLVYAFDKRILKTNRGISMAIKELHKMTHQFMSGIHGIYRVIGGALPVAIYFEFNRLGFAEGWQAITAFSLLVVFMSVVACYVLAKTAVYTAPREPYSKNMFLN